MTGFAFISTQGMPCTFNIQIKTLNSKSLDLNLRLDSSLRSKEIELRKILGNGLLRGKIDCSILLDSEESPSQYSIQKNVVESYLQDLQQMGVDTSNATDWIPAILRLPEAVSTTQKELATEDWEMLLPFIEKAIDEVMKFRKEEGNMLQEDVLHNVQIILDGKLKVRELFEKKKKDIETRLLEKLKALEFEYDSQRFHQELMYYIEKLDLSEELVRLEQHIVFFKENMHQDTPLKGKKLGFIVQEMGREINTIGSKANDDEIQRFVVNMKDSLEKIKEQIFNIL